MRMSYAEGLTSPEIEIAEGGTMLDNKRLFYHFLIIYICLVNLRI